MTQNKFKNIKIDKDKRYYIEHKIGVDLLADAFMFADGKNLKKTDKYLGLKTWKTKFHYMLIKKIEEVKGDTETANL